MNFNAKKILQSGTILFSVVFIALLFFYRYHQTSFDEPQGLHQWRQCVSGAYAMNYYNYDLDIKEARIYNYLAQDQTTDVTFVEIPVLYYSVAILYKIFGPDDSIFRIFNALIFLIGLYLLFKTLRFYLKDIFWSLIIVVTIFTSPTLVYYTNSFMPDTTAFAFVFMALYFLHRYLVKEKLSLLYLSSLFYLLAGTTKVTSLISLIAIIGAFVLMQLFDKDFRKKYAFIKHTIPAIIPFVAVVIWYYFVQWYNAHYGGTISAVEIRPIWEHSPETISRIWDRIVNVWLNSYYHVSLQIIALLSFLSSVIFFKKTNKYFTTVFILSVIGGASFFFLFFRSLFPCDYYLINVFIVILFALVNMFYLIKNYLPKAYKSPILKIAFALLIAFYAYECRKIVHDKHKGYYNITHKDRYSGFIGMEEYNREELGIEFSDLVISIPDPSIDITLYLMNQPGWSEFDLEAYQGAERIDYFISKGAKYLFISDPNIYNNEDYRYLIPYMNNKIGQYKNVAVYDLQNQDKTAKDSNIERIKDYILQGDTLVSTKNQNSFHFQGFETLYPKNKLDTSLAQRSNMHGYTKLCQLSSDFFHKNQWYELSFWYYNKGIRSKANMFIEQINTQGDNEWTDLFNLGKKGAEKDKWTLISHYFHCKEDTETLHFVIHYDSDPGIDIYYTDFLVRNSDADVYYKISDTLMFENNRRKVFHDTDTFFDE
ncbi:MAG: glycosyltransferase family 39 protein [Bacteroidales bacterium]